MHIDRRDVLVGLGSLSTIGLAGCAAGGDEVTRSGCNDGSKPVGTPPPAPSRTWLPARVDPDTQPTVLTYHGTASLLEYANVADYDRGAVDRHFSGSLSRLCRIRQSDILGVGTGRQFELSIGSFDVESIVETLTDRDDVTVERTYKGFTIVDREGARFAAIGSDAVLLTEELSRAERLIDTGVGANPRLGADDDVLTGAIDHVLGVTAAWVSVPATWPKHLPGRPRRQSVAVEGLTITREQTRVELAYGLSGPPDDWHPSDLRDELVERDVDDVTVDLSSNLVTATGTFPTSELDRSVLRYGARETAAFPLPKGGFSSGSAE